MMAWADALAIHGMNEDDAGRIAEAFRVMAANIEQWPAPATLVKFMPVKRRECFHRLPSPVQTPEEKNAEHNRRCEIIARESDRLANLLRWRS